MEQLHQLEFVCRNVIDFLSFNFISPALNDFERIFDHHKIELSFSKHYFGKIYTGWSTSNKEPDEIEM
jgi:hypothetical protein